jgi:hypothetical protein
MYMYITTLYYVYTVSGDASHAPQQLFRRPMTPLIIGLPYVAGNLPIKALVARRWPTNNDINVNVHSVLLWLFKRSRGTHLDSDVLTGILFVESTAE